MQLLGMSDVEQDKINLKEAKKLFKKKSMMMLPEKHPTVPNAHTKFEEVNSAFAKVAIKMH